MEDSAMFEEVACEELFDDTSYDIWMDLLEQENVNDELQEIAETQKSAQLTVELDYFLFGV